MPLLEVCSIIIFFMMHCVIFCHHVALYFSSIITTCILMLVTVLAAHSMMQKRLTSLVLESFGTQSYVKAMDCLKVLRAESISVCITYKYGLLSRAVATSVALRFTCIVWVWKLLLKLVLCRQFSDQGKYEGWGSFFTENSVWTKEQQISPLPKIKQSVFVF